MKILIDGDTYITNSRNEKNKVAISHVKIWAKGTSNPEFYNVKGCYFPYCRPHRALGWNRYVLLVEGRGKPDGHFLLDLKETLPSCLQK